MHIRMAAVAACVLTLGGSPAKADIIQATFSGTVSFGWDMQIYHAPNPLGGQPFSYTFVFDTEAGNPGPQARHNEQYGGLISSPIPLANQDLSFFYWADDLSTASARVSDGGFYNISVGFTRMDWFQLGTCGSHCGYLDTTSIVVTNLGPSPARPAPGPILGGGLPGLLAMLGLVLGWRRYVKVSVKVLPS